MELWIQCPVVDGKIVQDTPGNRVARGTAYRSVNALRSAVRGGPLRDTEPIAELGDIIVFRGMHRFEDEGSDCVAFVNVGKILADSGRLAEVEERIKETQ